MTSLQRGIGLVDDAMGWTDANRSLERVEIEKSGHLLFTASCDHGSRWFRFVDPILEELVPQEDDRVELCKQLREKDRPRIVSWRPGRRICIRSEQTGAVEFVKGYRRSKAQRSRANHERAVRASRSAGAFSVPLVHRDSVVPTSITLSEVEGIAVSVNALNASTFERTGMAIRAMQHNMPTDDLPLFSPDDELELLWNLANRFTPVLESLPRGWDSILARLARKRPQLEDRVATHRDLHPAQLKKTPMSVGLLDFDLLSQAHPMQDLGNLIAHLDLHALQRMHGATATDATVCSRALIDGYRIQAPPGSLRSLSFFKGTTLLRLALIYSVRPRWTALSIPLTQMAERCVDA